MNIVYNCDNNYVWIMGISMISLFENNKETVELNVYLLGDEISISNYHILSEIAEKYERNFILINVPDLNIPESLCNGRWPKSAFTRMFAGELLPSTLDKVLYLDADTIINDSISDIFEYDSLNYAVCGVKDCVSKLYKHKIGINSTDSYINAGVLLLNLEILRTIDIRYEMEEFLKKYSSSVNYADQDILNGIFNGKFGVLSPQYNVMTLLCVYNYHQMIELRRYNNYYTRKEINYCKSHPIIIHYTSCLLNVRPWQDKSYHPLAWVFERFKSMSPWADKPMSKANFSTSEYGIISNILKMPEMISFPLIGLLHSFMKPLYINLKSKF